MAYIPDDIFYYTQASINDMRRFYRSVYPNFSDERFEQLGEIYVIFNLVLIFPEVRVYILAKKCDLLISILEKYLCLLKDCVRVAASLGATSVWYDTI